VQRCLAKNPDDRWQSARDILLLLRDVGQAQTAEPATRARSSKPLMLTAVALALAVAALGFVQLRRAMQPTPEASELRFYVPPPEGGLLGPGTGWGRISPDGRRLIYRVNRGGGGPILWLRVLDLLEGQPISGTEGAQTPFW
jgi:hypothetical protein